MAARKNPRQPKNLSEERLKSVLQLSSDWYWEQDKNLRFTLFSGKTFGEAGFESADLIGRTRWEIPGARFEPGERAAVQAKLDAREPFIDHEYERVGPDGLSRTISASGVPVLDASGRFAGYRGIAKDITERKRAEELQSLEHSVAHRIAAAESVTAATTAVIRAICDAESWECGRYFRVDEEAGVLCLDNYWGVPEPAVQQYLERSNQRSREDVYQPGVGLVGQVWQTGEPLWVADVTKDARALRAAFTVDIGIRGGFVFPVVSGGKTIGVLAFNNRQVREPDERLLQAIVAIGGQIGQFLERKRAEEEQRLFRVALDNSADMILLIDRKTMRYVDVNQTVCKLLGYSREELLKMGPQDLLPESRGELERVHDELIANPSGISGMRSYFRCRDGSTMPFESTRHVLRSGDSYIIAAICRDIRERLAAEEAQREQVALIALSAEKDRLLTLFYELPFVGLAVTSPSSKRWLQVNDYMCEMLGYPREELLQLAWTETTHPEDLAENLALFKRLTAGEFDSFQFEKRFVRKDGGIVDTTTEVRCVRRGDGSVETVVIMVRDITERKLAERANVRLGRMFAALSATNDAILHATSVDELYRRVCDAAVHGGKFSNITILLAAEGSSRTKVVASAGRVPQELQATHVSIDETIPEGRGLVGIAYRTQRPCISNDFLHDERTRPWHEIGHKAGCRAAAAFPLIQGGRSIGAILIHYEELDAFDDEIVRLLESMAENVSFALDNFGREVERKRVEERIQHLASHDALTSLPNRVMFSEVLNMAIASAQRNNRKFAVLFIDLDRFKVINDTLGHEAGDKLLQEMGTRIKDTVRTGDVVARLSGDEFVVLVQEVGESAQVETVARKILSALIKPMIISGRECRVSASVGICMYPADAQTEQSLMKNADIAMYHAKEAGKNTYKFYSQDTTGYSRERLELETSPRLAPLKG